MLLDSLISEDILAKHLELLSETCDGIADAYRGYKAFFNNQFEKCVEHLTKAANDHPEFLPSRLQLGNAYLALHKWDLAEKIARLVCLLQ